MSKSFRPVRRRCCSWGYTRHGSSERLENVSAKEKGEDKETWSDFTQEVAMHGIKYLHLSNIHPVTKLLWLLTILFMIGYAVIASQVFFATYARQETTTKFKNIRVHELQFPTIVLCDHNSFTRWSIKATISARNLTGLDVLFKDLFSYGQLMSQTNWSSPEFSNLAELSSSQMEQLMFDLAPEPKYTFHYAAYRGHALNVSEEFKRVMTDMGICYVFNSDGKHMAPSAGTYSGLMVTLNAAVNSYYIGPAASSSGFSMAIYKPGEVPVVMTDANTGVKPGSSVNIVLDQVKIKRQPPPADNNTADCFDAENEPNFLSYYPEYSYNACYRECRANYSIEKCGCRHIFDPAVGGAETCKPHKLISCIVPAIYPDPNDLQSYLDDTCKCKNTCYEEHYTSQMAIYDYPNAQYLADLYNYPPHTIEYMKENIMQVTISYKSLSYNLLEEYLSYGWMDVIANLGGTLGVCIGASLLTICEFIQFGVNSLVRWCYRKREKRGKNSTQIHVLPAPAVTNKY